VFSNTPRAAAPGTLARRALLAKRNVLSGPHAELISAVLRELGGMEGLVTFRRYIGRFVTNPLASLRVASPSGGRGLPSEADLTTQGVFERWIIGGIVLVAGLYALRPSTPLTLAQRAARKGLPARIVEREPEPNRGAYAATVR
jgi:hypothetical protein